MRDTGQISTTSRKRYGDSSAEIARREALQKGYVARLMRLAFLSPSIVETVVEGRTPVELNLQMLMTTRVAQPLAWRHQEELPPQFRSGATC